MRKLALATLLVAELIAVSCTPVTHSTRPNLLIFQPDDLAHYWEDAPTHPNRNTARVSTPWMDRVRDEGAVFNRSYCASAMCAPSRYAVMTGRYASRSRHAQTATLACASANTLVDVTVPKTKLDEEVSTTLQTSLRAVGYMTGVVGKWHLSVEGRNPWLPIESAYPAQTAKALATGMDYADGFYVGNMDNACEAGLCANTLGFSHNPEWVTAKALEFFALARQAGMPFFLYMNPTLPHSPSAEEALNGLSILQTPAGTLGTPPLSGMPSRADVYARATSERGQLGNAISTTWIDDSLGAVYTNLSESGSLDDTLLLFVHDHGQAGKSTLFETGGRIAMFARYPNHAGHFFAAGRVYSALVSNIDIAPTMMELATGTRPPSAAEPYDGTSLLALSADGSLGSDGGERTLFLELNKDRVAVGAR